MRRSVLAGLIAALFVVIGAMAGAATAAAAEQTTSCGEPNGGQTCYYIPSGCGQGGGCAHYLCESLRSICPGVGTDCYLCQTGIP